MISYDDSSSIAEKGDFIVDRDLAGGMFWEFSADRNGVLLESFFTALGQEMDLVSERPSVSNGFRLDQPVPNPFNFSTIIRFSLPRSDLLTASVFDLQGRLVQVLVEDRFSAGTHTLTWDGGNLPDGIYFARLSTGNQSQVVKLVLVR